MASSTEEVDAKEILKSAETILKDKTGNHLFGIHLVEKYNLYADLELVDILEKLADLQKTDPIVKLVGKQSKMSVEDKDKTQRELLDKLLSTNFNKYGKICDDLIQKFGIPYEDYPLLIERKKRNSVFHFANQFLSKKQDDKEFMGLDRIEQIFHGAHECLVHLTDIVFGAGKKQMAKGIFMRNKLKAEDFSLIKASGKSKLPVGEELAEMSYDESKDYRPVKDMFEPVSLPSKEYMRFPLDIKIEFIDTEKKIQLLEELKGQKYVGVDAEWRPAPHRWYESKGPAIFQIAGKNEAFIIDMIKLGKNSKLNTMLKSIFTHKNTTIIGYAFASDISMFHKHCPQLTFINDIPKHLDAMKVFTKCYPDSKRSGLAVCCEMLMEKKLCKQEQMSNWESRPLRFSQEHYAAMDAWVLVQLQDKLFDQAKKQKI